MKIGEKYTGKNAKAKAMAAAVGAAIEEFAGQNMAQAIEKVRAMHEAHTETAEKLAGGLRQIIEAMRQSVAAMEEKWK